MQQRWGAEVSHVPRHHELELHPLDFQEEFQPDVIDLGEDIHQRTPLKTSGRAELVEEQHGKHKVVIDIRLRGTLNAGLELSCARCLEPVTQNVTRDFDLLYRPLGADAGRDELSVTDAEAEIGYYQGDGLLLEDVLREQVLLALPLKVTCSEDCRGLCLHCGKNLNQETMLLRGPDGRSAVGGVERDSRTTRELILQELVPSKSSSATIKFCRN